MPPSLARGARARRPPRSTTAGLKPYTGYTGPGVQDLINSGQMSGAGLGNLGYTPAPAGTTGPAVTPPPTPPKTSEELIANHWRVTGAQKAGATSMAAARGNFQTGLRQALINLGLNPSQLPAEWQGKLGEYIDNDTITNAVNNRYSTTAQIAQQRTKSQAQSEAALAARGMLSSGQTVKEAGDIQSAADQSGYDALQGFLSGAGEGLGGLASLQAENAATEATAIGEAGTELAGLYPGAFGAPTPVVKPMGPGGQPRLTRAQFKAQKPQGNYQKYLNFLARRRGSQL